MAECIDTLESKNSNSLTNTDGFTYSPTYQIYQLDRLQADFEKNASIIPTTNTFIDIFGQEVFNQALISFNNFLYSANYNTNTYLASTTTNVSTPSVIINIPTVDAAGNTVVNTNNPANLLINYTAVQDRVNTGVAITPIEFTVFMQDSGYNPISIQAAQIASPKTVLSLYNTNINGRFSQSTMGSFCALAPSIFGAISNFFTTIRNFANKITDIINAIASFSFAALLEALKSKITNVIESAIAKVKKVIENFTLDGLVSQVNQYFHSKVVAKFNTIKNEAMKFFEEINIDTFKKKIDSILTYASNIFKSISLEEIQFLIYRFCSFITQVENLINGIKNPLETFNNRYVYASRILKSNSSANTIAAIAAGATRFSDGDVQAAIGAGVSAESIRGNQQPPTPEERKNATQWNNGKGDNRINFEGQKWTLPRGSGGMGEEGWTGTSEDARVYLMRLYEIVSREYGIQQIRINSAYRDALYNANLKPKPGAVNSQHIKGHAFDCTWAGYPRYREEFIATARSIGFNGIGVYPGFVHIDRRPIEQATNWSEG